MFAANIYFYLNHQDQRKKIFANTCSVLFVTDMRIQTQKHTCALKWHRKHVRTIKTQTSLRVRAV